MIYLIVNNLTYFALFGLCAVSIYILFIRSYLRRKQLKMPGVKGGFPIFGQSLELINGSPWNVMTQWAKTYGPIFTFHMFGNDAVVVTDPDLLKIIFQTKLTTFNKDLEWVYAPFLDILGNGLVTSHGESWRKQRTLLSHALRIDILEEIPLMAMKAFQRLSLKLDKCCSDGSTIEMASEFRHLTLQVIAEAVLSISPDESDQTFAHMYLPIVDEGNMRIWHPERYFIPNSSWWNYPKAVKTLNNYVNGIIVRRWELRLKEQSAGGTTRRQDILDKVLSAVTPSEWNDATIKQICDEVKTFILAGHETSASMLAWALYEVTKKDRPEYLVTLRKEVDKIFPIHDNSNAKAVPDVPPKDEISKLVYAECCLRESLRRYAIVPSLARVCATDVELDGHHLAKGTSIIINIQGVHHDDKYWPDAKKYLPDRFLNPIEPYTFVAFAEGPRTCLGQFLALLETKIVLSLLVRNYEFETINEDAGQTHPFMVPIIPKTGHIMKVSKRVV
jgi:cytochrome P450